MHTECSGDFRLSRRVLLSATGACLVLYGMTSQFLPYMQGLYLIEPLARMVQIITGLALVFFFPGVVFVSRVACSLNTVRFPGGISSPVPTANREVGSPVSAFYLTPFMLASVGIQYVLLVAVTAAIKLCGRVMNQDIFLAIHLLLFIAAVVACRKENAIRIRVSIPRSLIIVICGALLLCLGIYWNRLHLQIEDFWLGERLNEVVFQADETTSMRVRKENGKNIIESGPRRFVIHGKEARIRLFNESSGSIDYSFLYLVRSAAPGRAELLLNGATIAVEDIPQGYFKAGKLHTFGLQAIVSTRCELPPGKNLVSLRYRLAPSSPYAVIPRRDRGIQDARDDEWRLYRWIPRSSRGMTEMVASGGAVQKYSDEGSDMGNIGMPCWEFQDFSGMTRPAFIEAFRRENGVLNIGHMYDIRETRTFARGLMKKPYLWADRFSTGDREGYIAISLPASHYADMLVLAACGEFPFSLNLAFFIRLYLLLVAVLWLVRKGRETSCGGWWSAAVAGVATLGYSSFAINSAFQLFPDTFLLMSFFAAFAFLYAGCNGFFLLFALMASLSRVSGMELVMLGLLGHTVIFGEWRRGVRLGTIYLATLAVFVLGLFLFGKYHGLLDVWRLEFTYEYLHKSLDEVPSGFTAFDNLHNLFSWWFWGACLLPFAVRVRKGDRISWWFFAVLVLFLGHLLISAEARVHRSHYAAPLIVFTIALVLRYWAHRERPWKSRVILLVLATAAAFRLLVFPFDFPAYNTLWPRWKRVSQAFLPDPCAVRPKTGHQSRGGTRSVIPAGTFLMGRDREDGGDDELPRHAVWVEKFEMDVDEVTNDRYRRFIEESGYQAEGPWYRYAGEGREQYPVVAVTWSDANAFAQWHGLRLPTEAEWEKAARGGIENRPYPGSRENLWQKTCCHENRGNGTPPTMPVGSFSPNEYGLHDIHGNVYEWCADWYGEEYYHRSPDLNPTGPETGIFRVIRGGGWASSNWLLRAAHRGRMPPATWSLDTGFRCVRACETGK